ncbi:hypothetical protein B0H21DRAFT_162124 [Amylocystis lapponica]|nr:hypothetical protein B0H21DRAFT_162124 [Amylocystis lapponica]
MPSSSGSAPSTAQQSTTTSLASLTSFSDTPEYTIMVPSSHETTTGMSTRTQTVITASSVVGGVLSIVAVVLTVTWIRRRRDYGANGGQVTNGTSSSGGKGIHSGDPPLSLPGLAERAWLPLPSPGPSLSIPNSAAASPTAVLPQIHSVSTPLASLVRPQSHAVSERVVFATNETMSAPVPRPPPPHEPSRLSIAKASVSARSSRSSYAATEHTSLPPLLPENTFRPEGDAEDAASLSGRRVSEAPTMFTTTMTLPSICSPMTPNYQGPARADSVKTLMSAGRRLDIPNVSSMPSSYAAPKAPPTHRSNLSEAGIVPAAPRRVKPVRMLPSPQGSPAKRVRGPRARKSGVPEIAQRLSEGE